MNVKLSPQALYQARRRAKETAITFFMRDELKQRLDADVARLATKQQIWLNDATEERLARHLEASAVRGPVTSSVVAAVICALIVGAAGGGFLPSMFSSASPPSRPEQTASALEPSGMLRIRVIDAAGHVVADQRLDGAGGVREFHLASENVVPGLVEVTRDARGYERSSNMPDIVRVKFDGNMPGDDRSTIRTLNYDFAYTRSAAVGTTSQSEASTIKFRGSLVLDPGETVRLPFKDAAGQPSTLVITKGGRLDTPAFQDERKYQR